MIKKAVIIIILVASLLMPTVTVSAKIYNIKIEPEYDGYCWYTIKNDIDVMDKSAHRSSLSWASFYEWNLSNIPLNATILNITFHWTIVDNRAHNAKVRIQEITTKPSEYKETNVENKSLYLNIINGETLYSRYAFSSLDFDYHLNKIQDNISRGWYSFGHIVRRYGTFGDKYFHVASTRSDNPPYMWITYHVPSVFAQLHPTPSNNSVVGNPSVSTGITVSHINPINLTFKLYNTSSGTWNTFMITITMDWLKYLTFLYYGIIEQ